VGQEVHRVQPRPGQQAARRHRPHKKDGHGIRLLPSGKPPTIEISVVPAFGAWPDVALLVSKDWEAVGIKTIVQIRERALHFKMNENNELMAEIWNEDTSAFPTRQRLIGRSRATCADPDNRVRCGGRLVSSGRQGGRRSPSRRTGSGIVRDQSTRRARLGPDEQVKLRRSFIDLGRLTSYEIGTVGLDADGAAWSSPTASSATVPDHASATTGLCAAPG
jgi:peptide/nickel transport system substrate-binding protein